MGRSSMPPPPPPSGSSLRTLAVGVRAPTTPTAEHGTDTSGTSASDSDDELNARVPATKSVLCLMRTLEQSAASGDSLPEFDSRLRARLLDWCRAWLASRKSRVAVALQHPPTVKAECTSQASPCGQADGLPPPPPPSDPAKRRHGPVATALRALECVGRGGCVDAVLGLLEMAQGQPTGNKERAITPSLGGDVCMYEPALEDRI